MKDRPDPLCYAVNGRVGSTYRDPVMNRITFQTGMEGIPAPEAITYAIFKPALLAMVEAWTPALCYAYPHELLGMIDNSINFRENWMLYLGPHLAPFVTPPATAINERLADGGLLMSATTETFKIDNPHHMAVARDIAVAVAHLKGELLGDGL
jgi:hypothetical protein